ncbi:MAG: phage terminase large subunit [Gemmataceae bacterium]
MSRFHPLALALDPSLILRASELTPDPWQRSLLMSSDRQILLNCSRQSGKSTVVSALALHTALFQPKALVLLLSPSQRQSSEIFRKVRAAYGAIGRPIATVSETEHHLELVNGSRIVSLPGREGTIRSFSGVTLLVIDEAARVPDDLYRSVRPMLAVSRGRLICLSTPFGQRGFFFEEWHSDGPWKKIQIAWRDCPRITDDFIAEELRALGAGWVDQEYNCLFTALEGLVYPDFADCLSEEESLPAGKAVGGIDFGWRNPFAAVWGVLADNDVLWIGHEHYGREMPLHDHAQALPRQVTWYADPAGRTEIEELRRAGFVVRSANNDIRLGIAAVTARLRTGRLKVSRRGCPHLCDEARRYRYPTANERRFPGENPIDEHNHALGALRYLVSRLDARFIARLRGERSSAEGPFDPGAGRGLDAARRRPPCLASEP